MPASCRPRACSRGGRAFAGALLIAAGLLPVPALAEAPPGDYLAARAALAARDYEAAGPMIARALEGDPANVQLLEGAAVAGLARGDLDAAADAAAVLAEAGTASQPAHLATLARLARDGDWRGLLSELEAGRGAGPLLDGAARGWARLGEGDAEAALSAFDELAAQEGFAAFGLTHKALALAASGDPEGAVALLSDLDGRGPPRARRSLIALAELLGGMGRADEAVAILDEALGRDLDPALAALRARLVAGEAVPFTVAPDAGAGFAEALFGIAAIAAEGDPLAALLYARAALAVEPGHADAALLAARALERLDQPEAARAAYALVDPADPAFLAAEMGRAASLRRSGQGEVAAEILQALARAHPGLPELEATLGDTLRTLSRFAEAEAAYDRAIAAYAEEDGPLWFVHYTRAIARQAGGNWDGAEADLRRALDLRPGQPQVLNHLGYSLVERGESLDEALAMIEEAVAAEPRNGAIVDSLGWAFFKLGRYGEAVTELERAAGLLPLDPVINDHLGDAYWKVGREREARFQWHRALSLNPAPEDAARIRLKLERGLDAVEAEEEKGGVPAPAPVAEGTHGG
jgi:tetratricopeptide (TPR) repeat protein